MGLKVRGSNPGAGEISAPCLTGPRAKTASYTVGILSFPEVQRLAGGVNHPHHLGPTLKKGYSNTSTPLCIVMTDYRVKFTLPQQQACKKTFVLGEIGTHLETVSLIITVYDIFLWLLGT
jgi:hypothetical protein